jgi:hypothetical protein
MVHMDFNRRVFATVWFACLVAMSTQTGASGGQDGVQQTWQGFVTDTHCGTNCRVVESQSKVSHTAAAGSQVQVIVCAH